MITANTNLRRIGGYIRSVLDGSAVTGAIARAAVQRHVDDLVRAESDDWLYEFNAIKAERACAFFPRFLRHSKGEWAGHPFELSDWQLFVIANLFGWVRKADGYRRFRKAYISLARKNGKSTIAAGIALMLLILDKEAGAEVFVGATKRDQATIIHNEARRMVHASPSLSRFATVHKYAITVDGTNSFFHPIASNKPYDGHNPHGVIFDELHAFREEHRDFHETMSTGGASRRQPLEVTVTTAGNDKSLLWREADRAVRNVITGAYQDETVFGFICTIDGDDDPFDEAVWAKANPNLGTSVKLSYLRDQARDSQATPTRRNAFIRYHCNREVSSVEDAITAEVWDASEGELSNWADATYIGGGIDLGGRDDLAAFALCAKFPVAVETVIEEDGEEVERTTWRYEIRSKAYIESDCMRDLSTQPWAQWLHEEKLTKSENLIPDLRDDFEAICSELGVYSFAFDPYNARQIGAELETSGMTAVKMPQNYGHFNEPLREFMLALKDGRVRHDGDPILRWAALNMAIKEGARKEWMPAKDRSKDKIDPIVAVIMAFREAYFQTVDKSWSFADGATL